MLVPSVGQIIINHHGGTGRTVKDGRGPVRVAGQPVLLQHAIEPAPVQVVATATTVEGKEG